MKPHKLVLEGFSSYGLRQEIDFSKLIRTGIFIIQGETGAGKSSIIDGIIFALYGRIPRFNKDPKKENFINYDFQRCLVDFEFSIRNLKGQYKTYKITRLVPRNSSGIVEIREKEDGNQFKRKYPTSPNEATKFISEEIIGLPYESFIRTIVLPQGKFSEFLLSTPSQKSDIILKIAGIEDIYIFLKNKLHENLIRIELTEKSYDQKLQELGEIDQKRVLEEFKGKLIATENDIKNKKIQIEEIEKEIEDLEHKRTELENYLSKINHLENLKEEKTKIHQSINKKLDEKSTYEKLIEELSLKIKVLENLYENIKERDIESRAKELLSLSLEKLSREITDFLRAKNEFARKSEIIRKKSEELIKVENLLESESKKLLKLPDIKTVRKIKNEFTKLSEIINKKKFINDAIYDIEKSIKDKEEILNHLKDEIQIKQEQIKKLEEEKQKLEVDIEKEKIKKISADIKRNLKEGDICPVCGNIVKEKLHDTYSDLQLVQIQKKYESITKELESKRKNLGEILGKEEANRKEKENLEKKIQQKKGELKEEEKKENEIYIRIKEIVENIHHLNFINQKIDEILVFGGDISEILEKLSAIEEENLNCEKEVNQLTANKEKISEIIRETEKDIREIQERLSITKGNIHTFSDDLKRIEDLSNICLKSVKEISEIIIKNQNGLTQKILSELLNLEDLSVQIIEKISKINFEEKFLDKAQKDINYISDVKSKLSDSLLEFIRKLERSITKNETDLGEKKSSLEKVLHEIKYYESKINDINNEINKLESEINDLSKKFIQGETFGQPGGTGRENKELSEEWKMILSNIENAELKISIENKLKEIILQKKEKLEAKAKLNQEIILLSETKGSIEREIKEIEKKIEEKKELERKREELIKEKKIVSMIYDDFSGTIRKPSFKNYLTWHFIKRVVDYGGKILKEISSGRYSLKMSQDGNIKIIDSHYQDRERDPESLSGGELFISSLSLALSLATSMIGRSKFECFFIDEGFGSLDQESLETVINSLEKLAVGGINLGIVSHVDEMNKIEHFSKLKVTKRDNKYSVAEVVYPAETTAQNKSPFVQDFT